MLESPNHLQLALSHIVSQDTSDEVTTRGLRYSAYNCAILPCCALDTLNTIAAAAIVYAKNYYIAVSSGNFHCLAIVPSLTAEG